MKYKCPNCQHTEDRKGKQNLTCSNCNTDMVPDYPTDINKTVQRTLRLPAWLDATLTEIASTKGHKSMPNLAVSILTDYALTKLKVDTIKKVS